MRAKIILAFVLGPLVVGSAALAQEAAAEKLLVVVHKDSPIAVISKNDVKNIFLGNVTFWGDNVPLVPIVRDVRTAAGQALFADLLNMAPTRFRQYWQSRQLAGRGVAPQTTERLPATIERVAAARGAISVIVASEAGVAGARVRVVPIQ